jgi:hypothetical protein
MMSLNLLSLLGFRLCTRLRAPDHPPQASEKSEVFLLSEDILKAGNYDHPLQKYRKRKYIKPLYSLSTHAQSSMNPRHCEM